MHNLKDTGKIIRKFTIDEIIAYCDKVCREYELISEQTGRAIHCIDDYMRHYQIEECLNELKEYKAMDSPHFEKCREGVKNQNQQKRTYCKAGFRNVASVIKKMLSNKRR